MAVETAPPWPAASADSAQVRAVELDHRLVRHHQRLHVSRDRHEALGAPGPASAASLLSQSAEACKGSRARRMAGFQLSPPQRDVGSPGGPPGTPRRWKVCAWLLRCAAGALVLGSGLMTSLGTPVAKAPRSPPHRLRAANEVARHSRPQNKATSQVGELRMSPWRGTPRCSVSGCQELSIWRQV